MDYFVAYIIVGSLFLGFELATGQIDKISEDLERLTGGPHRAFFWLASLVSLTIWPLPVVLDLMQFIKGRVT